MLPVKSNHLSFAGGWQHGLRVPSLSIMQTPWVVGGCRSLCRTFVNLDFNLAQEYVYISAIYC